MNLTTEQEIKTAKEAFINMRDDDGVFYAMFRADSPDGISIGIIDLDGAAKWDALCGIVAETKATKIVFMADTDYLVLEKGSAESQEWPESDKRVRDYEQKKDAFMVNIITAEEVITSFNAYHVEDGEVVWDDALPQGATIEAPGAQYVSEAMR